MTLINTFGSFIGKLLKFWSLNVIIILECLPFFIFIALFPIGKYERFEPNVDSIGILSKTSDGIEMLFSTKLHRTIIPFICVANIGKGGDATKLFPYIICCNAVIDEIVDGYEPEVNPNKLPIVVVNTFVVGI